MMILKCDIQIGALRADRVNNVMIRKGIFSLQDTAVIVLPSTSVLQLSDEAIEGPLPASVQTPKEIKVGDAVRIRLGYNRTLQQEFIGFVSRVNYNVPCEIECEGYSWMLRKRTNIVKTWPSTTLKEVLAEIVRNTPIRLHPAIPDMPLKNLVVNNVSGLQLLQYVLGLLKGVLTAFFINDQLYVGLSYEDVANATVKYRLDWNTIDSDKLKYHLADETEVKVELNFRNDSGAFVRTTTGKDGGLVRKETLSAITDLKVLQEIAKAKLRQESFDGYEGTITTFGVPYVQPGYRAQITDARFNERQGNYFVDSVETSFGMNGFRRLVGLGIKLSK
jgi:hypothetical protein